ncbi:hypothetical protein [Fusobacterium sp.]|uniref:hypothetical protein n=1 Tax=Fusobacterium sp. TaxID=68766 RepID=UPI0028FEDA26|nr:hypothetical protein [Fusobacterium sp.]MDU1910165.1 hypothetical protein [Fusobacterium sp.]
MKEMTNLDIIFEMYEKPYIKNEKDKNNYHEITNSDIICYIYKKIEEKIEAVKKDKYTEIKDSFFNKRLGISK